MPKTGLITFSVHLRMHSFADGAFITLRPVRKSCAIRTRELTREVD
jgi:hypothetical protein